MLSTPLVSVIIPTYNCADYLRIAIQSVLSQTLEDFELLVLDNASTDHTPEVVRHFRDPRLVAVRNPENLGFIGNVNLGLQRAQGTFLAYLGADDLWDPEFLGKTIACLQAAPQMSFVHTAAIWMDENGKAFGQSLADWASVTPGETAFLDCFRYGYCTSALLMRTTAVRKGGGFDPQWGDLADTALFLRLCFAGDVGFIREPLVRYRVHQRSLSSALYRQGEYFRQYLRLAEQAFFWPQAQQLQLHLQKARGLHYIVAEAIKALHLVRASGSRWDFLRSFAEVTTTSPHVLWFPSTWMRFVLGLLPRSVIFTLQRWKRRRWQNTRPPQPALSPKMEGASQ